MARNNGTDYLNFNGGTLKAGAANGTFIAASVNVNVYGGGATIDNGGNAVTIAQPLQAPAGAGVAFDNTNFANLTGLSGEPLATLSGGGGTGATARAIFNPATGTVTGIVITNPGVNYTSAPTITLSGGGLIVGAGYIGQITQNSSGGLTVVGSGVLTLTAANTYGGPTAVNAGTLFVPQTAALPNYASAGTVSVASGATLEVEAGGPATDWVSSNLDGLLPNAAFAPGSTFGVSVPAASNSFTYANDIGAGQAGKNFTKFGPGLMVLSGSNSYTGTTLISAGTLQFGFGGAANPLATTSIVNNGTVVFDYGANTALSIPVSGSGNFVQAGAGMLTLAASNTYAGATAVTGGTLQLGVNNALPATTAATFNGGTLDLNGHGNPISQLIVNNSAISQANGALTVTTTADGATQIGGAAGTSGSYTMSGGALSVTVAPLDVGWYGNGTFNQTGGTVSGGNYVVVGRQAGSTGNYSLSGGVLAQTGTGSSVIVGQSGAGTLTVSGSALVSAAGNGVGVGGGFAGFTGTGTLNLNGGTVQTTKLLGNLAAGAAAPSTSTAACSRPRPPARTSYRP